MTCFLELDDDIREGHDLIHVGAQLRFAREEFLLVSHLVFHPAV